MPTVESLILYFNIAILVFLALGALLGLKRGFFKSAYNLTAFLGLLLIGLLISPLFVKMILNFNISTITTVEIEGVAITSLSNSITPLAGAFMPELAGKVVPGTETYALVYEFMAMIAKLIFIIVWFFLTVTVFKFISWIIYLIVKPKKKEGKKKTWSSRFIGMGIGFAHALVVIFLISIPLGGIMSIASSAEALLGEQLNGETLDYDEQDVPLINLASEGENEIVDSIFEFVTKYRSTLVGGIGGLIKIQGEGLDERAFSSMFTIKYNKKRIRLTSELNQGLKIYGLIDEKIEGDITIEAVFALDDATINYVVTNLKKLKIVNILPPVGLEIAWLSGQLDMITEAEYASILTEILKIDFSNDISSLADVGVKAGKLGLFEPQQTDFYLNLDVIKVKEIFTAIGNIELLNAIDDFALDFILKQESIREALTNANVDPDEILLTDVSLGEEIANLGNLYEAFKAMEIAFDLDTNKINLAAVTDESINLFSTAIYNSKLFSNNTKVLTKILMSQLPEEYKDVLTIDTIEKADFVSILSLGVILVKANILSEDFDFTDLFTETVIDKIATHVSASHLLADNINGVLDIILSEASLPFAVEVPESFTWYGAPGKQELKALLGSAGKLFELGIAEENFIANLNSTNINELANILDDSVILMHNMNNLLNFVIDESGISATVTITIREIDWTSVEGKAEFRNVLGAAAVLFDAKLLDNPNFAELSDGTADTNGDGFIDEHDDNIIKDLASKLSASIIIKDNLSGIINQLVSKELPDLELETFDDPNEWTELELDSIFRATKIIITKNNLPEDLFALSENEMDIILNSKLISKIFVKTIEKEAALGGSLNGILIVERASGLWFDTYIGEVRQDGELRKLIKSAKTLLGETPNFDDPANIVNINAILDLNDEKLDELTASVVLKDSIAKQLIDLGTDKDEGGVITKAMLVVNIPQFDSRWDTEIPNFIKGIKVLVGETVDLDNFDVDVNKIKTLTNNSSDPLHDEVGTMLASLIISDTIIDKIIGLGETGGSLIVNLTANDSRWYDTESEDGEVRRLIKTLNLILGETGDLNDPSAIVVDDIVSLEEAEINTLVTSIVIVDTAINSIEKLTSPSGSLYNVLIIPNSLTNPDYHGVDGELKKFLVAVKAIRGSGTIETTTFDVDKFLGDDRDTLLESQIIEASTISFVKSSDKLLIPTDEMQYYYLANKQIVWERTYIGEALEDEGELRKFLTGMKILVGSNTFASMTFDMNTMLSIDFTEVLKSRVLESTVADMVNNLIITGALTGIIKEPSNGYQWFRDELSQDVNVGNIRRGEYQLTVTPTHQYSDLLGFINAIQMMDAAGLNYNTIDISSIVAIDSTVLATAFWDYSRVTRGSVATLLNYVLKDITHPFKPTFTDSQFNSKQDVIDGLDSFKLFATLI